MSQTSKKRRLNDGASQSGGSDSNGSRALSVATAADKACWQGFCEIDSDPAFFSVMLEEFGVRNLRVREVYSLDEDMLAFLPRPVHGLIFLFKYRADDATKQEASCPDHVWFANQTHDQACATVALLNIVNNIPGAHLGENLTAFREFTEDFPPALRGDVIGSFEFVKNVHNSFARKMDMMNIDLALQNRFDDRRKRAAPPASKKTAPNKATSKPKRTQKADSVVTDDDYADDENAFHFIAFVPIANEVWKMDGLERQPVKLGTLPDSEGDGHDDWLSLVVSDLGARMAQFEANDINFNLLACVQDPLVDLQARLGEQTRAIKTVEGRLDEDGPRGWWRDSSEVDAGVPASTDDSDEGLGTALSENTLQRLDKAGTQGEALLNLRHELLDERMQTLASVASEDAEAEADREKARESRHDFSPLIQVWLQMLAAKEGLVKDLVDEVR